ncbi:MAG: BatA domain-containing protein [Candidatus Krumholzibacteriia bacterium]
MPLFFGNPGLLFGAFAAALPVLIHFLSRRRVRQVPFSDLRFLDEVQARQARSLGVRRWLLLLLRVLAVLLVALAAAAPRWGGLAATGTRAVLLVVDTSASMGTQTGQGTRLDEAVADCRRLLAALPPGAEVQVIAAGARNEALFAQWLPAGAGVAQGLQALRVSDGALDLPAVLRLAARQVARAPGPAVDVVLVGDLQALPPDPRTAEAAAVLKDAGEVRLILRRVGAPAAQGGVLEVLLPGRAVLAGETVTIQARVLPARADQVFTLHLGDRPVAEAVANGPAGVEQVVSFPLAVPGPGLHTGSVRKESDALPADDARPFVLAVPAAIPVLLGHGADRSVDGAVGRGAWRVLAEALAPGGDASLFRITALPADELTGGAMAAAGLTVLVDPDPVGRQVLAGLREDLAEGGALLLVTGDPTGADYLTGTLLPLLGLQGPAVYANTGEGAGQRARVLDRGHPVFAGLPADALATLEDVAWRRWFRVPTDGASVPLALAGDDALLVTGQAGAGRWALLPFNLRPEAGDLPGSPMALPLLRRLCTWLARPAELAAAANLEVGQELVLRPLPGPGGALADDPADLRVAGPEPGLDRQAHLQWRGAQPLLSGGLAEAAGVAVFTSGRDTVGVAACGVPAAESDPTLAAAADWAAPLQAAGLAVTSGLADRDPEAVAAAFGGTVLAPWLLAAALALLGLELWLGRGAPAGA